MGRALQLLGLMVLASVFGVSPAEAETPLPEGAVVSVNVLGARDSYPTLSRGRVVLVNAQRYVVTHEPLPVAKSIEAPPEPQVSDAEQPAAPSADAIWVEGHWSYGASGFVWVAGRYIAARAGHAFVPPRWAILEEQYFFFSGFYVPYGVYVRSHFNRYYYSGTAHKGSRREHGPYWPVGAPSRANSALTSASARDPYWPIGAKR